MIISETFRKFAAKKQQNERLCQRLASSTESSSTCISTTTIRRTCSLPRRALRLVYEWLDLHRDELMENWERLSNCEAAKKIDPLK
jgi:hypothetical protein